MLNKMSIFCIWVYVHFHIHMPDFRSVCVLSVCVFVCELRADGVSVCVCVCARTIPAQEIPTRKC